MADEIRAKEAAAGEIIATAKAEGARMIASARTAGEQAVKEAKQKSHRSFRDQVKDAEREAEALAVKTVEAGREETERFYAGKKPKTAEVADWLLKEVMSTYGN
jgi:V/A-type H+-transporting ATPase subunit G/H